MNTNQKTAVIIACLLAASALVYVPWNHVSDEQERTPAGYAFIWQAPTLERQHTVDILGFNLSVERQVQANEIDLLGIGIELAMVMIFASAAVLILADQTKPEKPESKAPDGSELASSVRR